MIDILLIAVASSLLVSLGLGLVRVVRGPTDADRMLSAQLFGTHGVALLLVFAVLQSQQALIHVALVLAILAPLSLIAFVRLARSPGRSVPE